MPKTLSIKDWNHFIPIRVEYDLGLFYAIRTDWLARLMALRCPGNANPPGPDEIRRFAEYLVENQRTEYGINRFVGSWTIPRDTNMPSDARVDFAYFPSYIALACLMLVRNKYPEIATQVRGIDGALVLGGRFAAGRSFRGHGYDATDEMITALSILAAGTMIGSSGHSGTVLLEFRRAMLRSIRELPTNQGNPLDWGSVPEADIAAARRLLNIEDPIDDEFICKFLASRIGRLVKGYEEQGAAQ